MISLLGDVDGAFVVPAAGPSGLNHILSYSILFISFFLFFLVYALLFILSPSCPSFCGRSSVFFFCLPSAFFLLLVRPMPCLAFLSDPPSVFCLGLPFCLLLSLINNQPHYNHYHHHHRIIRQPYQVYPVLFLARSHSPPPTHTDTYIYVYCSLSFYFLHTMLHPPPPPPTTAIVIVITSQATSIQVHVEILLLLSLSHTMDCTAPPPSPSSLRPCLSPPPPYFYRRFSTLFSSAFFDTPLHSQSTSRLSSRLSQPARQSMAIQPSSRVACRLSPHPCSSALRCVLIYYQTCRPSFLLCLSVFLFPSPLLLFHFQFPLSFPLATAWMRGLRR